MTFEHGTHSVSLVALFQPGAATNGQLAELLGDLIRYSVQFLMTLTVRLIEERQLCLTRVTQFVDPKPQQPYWQMTRREVFGE